MAKLEDINKTKSLTITAYKQHADQVEIEEIPSLSPIVLAGDDVPTFLTWATEGWRSDFEIDLQNITTDIQGRPLLTTWMRLDTFRDGFCAGGRELRDEKTRKLMDRLLTDTKSWHSSGAELVDITGYQI